MQRRRFCGHQTTMNATFMQITIFNYMIMIPLLFGIPKNSHHGEFCCRFIAHLKLSQNTFISMYDLDHLFFKFIVCSLIIIYSLANNITFDFNVHCWNNLLLLIVCGIQILYVTVCDVFFVFVVFVASTHHSCFYLFCLIHFGFQSK